MLNISDIFCEQALETKSIDRLIRAVCSIFSQTVSYILHHFELEYLNSRPRFDGRLAARDCDVPHDLQL